MYFASQAYKQTTDRGREVYENLFAKAFIGQISFVRNEAGSLYTVTNASGQSIFYKYTELDIKSDAFSFYMSYYNAEFIELYKYLKTN